LVEHSRARSRPSTRQLRAGVFRDAAALVEAEFSRPLTVDDLARRVATSPRQLRRAFSEIGGTSFRRFLTEVRMRHAGDLLESTDMPVSEVGRRVGYPGAAQFTKAFKRAYAVTPSEYRAARR
jgi:AraC family transcriptional regulator of adaptative response / methylphosphotriester-DNA alkyltransferase methyltransferase